MDWHGKVLTDRLIKTITKYEQTPKPEYIDGIHLFCRGSICNGQYGLVDIEKSGIMCINAKIESQNDAAVNVDGECEHVSHREFEIIQNGITFVVPKSSDFLKSNS